MLPILYALRVTHNWSLYLLPCVAQGRCQQSSTQLSFKQRIFYDPLHVTIGHQTLAHGNVLDMNKPDAIPDHKRTLSKHSGWLHPIITPTSKLRSYETNFAQRYKSTTLLHAKAHYWNVTDTQQLERDKQLWCFIAKLYATATVWPEMSNTAPKCGNSWKHYPQ